MPSLDLIPTTLPDQLRQLGLTQTATDHRGTSAREPSLRASDKHLRSIWFGQAANFKARAYRRASELVTTP